MSSQSEDIGLTAAGGGGGAPPHPLVEQVSKTFGRRRVLCDMRIELAPGELHGLVGQNGSGKSTLVKVLTGIHTPDAGASIEVDGVPLATPVKPAAMREVGMSVVHQTLGLIEDATVVENVRAGRYTASRLARRINWRAEREQVREVLARLGASLDLDSRVSHLAAEDRATVAIARAFQDHRPGRGLIIFDESTRALTSDSLDRFYEMVATVRAAGSAVLMISHRIEEVLEVADRVTVLRDGWVAAHGTPCGELDEAALVRLMIGRDLNRAVRASGERRQSSTSEPEVRVTGLSGGALQSFSADLPGGEVVGVTGLIGSGFEEIPYLLSGATRARAGQLMVGGTKLELSSMRDPIVRLLAAGVAFVPERRAEEGLALEMTVQENLTLPRVRAKGSAAWSGLGWQREETRAMIERLDIRPPAPDASVNTLSGGNQQKVLLGKWLASQPRLLLLHEPTQAVDVGARQDIIRAIRNVAKQGCAVLVAGTDAQELSVLCDRVVVMEDGVIRDVLTGDLDEDAIVHATFRGVHAAGL